MKKTLEWYLHHGHGWESKYKEDEQEEEQKTKQDEPKLIKESVDSKTEKRGRFAKRRRSRIKSKKKQKLTELGQIRKRKEQEEEEKRRAARKRFTRKPSFQFKNSHKKKAV